MLYMAIVGIACLLWFPMCIFNIYSQMIALVADSEEKLCRLVSKFGRVCERRKLRVNVGKSKAMSCPGYGNPG